MNKQKAYREGTHSLSMIKISPKTLQGQSAIRHLKQTNTHTKSKLTTTLFLIFRRILSERHLDTIIDRDAVVLNSEVGCFIMSLDNAVRHLGKQIIDSSSILRRGVEDGGSDLVRILLNVVSINSTIQVDLVTHQK